MSKHRITEEEKIAINIGNILCDLRLDIELIGRYIARSLPTIAYNRLIVIAESAEYEKEETNDYNRLLR